MSAIALAPLSPEAFAPYGEVFAPASVIGRVDHVARLDNRRPAAVPNLFLARSGVIALPHAFARMESHPWSSQSFVPFGDAPMLVVVALAAADGQPDLATLRGFLARSQGFSYRAGVWHLPVASLGTATTVLGFMYEDGSPQDCVWAEIEASTLCAA